MHRRCDRHRIDPGVLKKIAKIGCRHDLRMETLASGKFRWVQVANADNARRLAVCKIADEVRTPVAVPNNTNSNESILHATPIQTKGFQQTPAPFGAVLLYLGSQFPIAVSRPLTASLSILSAFE